MLRTRVGYAGGTLKAPTYHAMGDHTETIQIDFDPKRISYAQLLEVFWAGHDPTGPAWSRQYRGVVLAHGPEQEQTAKVTRDALQAKLAKPITTAIETYTSFTRAEDYHQKFRLRSVPALANGLMAVYPEGKAFADSTAAMRVNAYLAGCGDRERFERELPQLGLGPEARALLRKAFAPAKH